MITFDTRPDRYTHWKLTFDGPSPRCRWTCARTPGLSPDYKLKLNSYDLGVDIELADAIQRLRFEHPEVRTRHRHVAQGAHLLRRREHHDAARLVARRQGELLQVHQRDAPRDRGRERALGTEVPRRAQRHLRRRRLRARARLRRDRPRRRRQFGGQPAGGAAARRPARHRRPDARRRQAATCGATSPISSARSSKASRASARSNGGSSTPCYPTSQFKEAVQKRARELAAASDRPAAGPGITLNPLNPTVAGSALTYSAVTLAINRDKRTAELTVQAPDRSAAVDAGRDPAGRRSVLAAARVPRARRCAAAAARQRAGDRHRRHPHRRRSRRGARGRPDAASRTSRTGWSARSSCS